MLDFLRNLTKSDEDKRLERLSAYLDDALSPAQTARLEQELAADADLRREVQRLESVKSNLSRLPSVRAPRNFTLDPARYGKPASQPAIQLYPVMRAATVITAIMLVVAVSVEFLGPSFGRESVAEAPVTEQTSVTRIVEFESEAAEAPEEVEIAAEEIVVETEAIEVPAEEPVEAAEAIVMDDVEVEEAAPMEAAVEEPMATQAELPAEDGADEAFMATPVPTGIPPGTATAPPAQTAPLQTAVARSAIEAEAEAEAADELAATVAPSAIGEGAAESLDETSTAAVVEEAAPAPAPLTAAPETEEALGEAAAEALEETTRAPTSTLRSVEIGLTVLLAALLVLTLLLRTRQ